MSASDPTGKSSVAGWQVVATNIKTGERRILSGCKSKEDAEAIVMMAVARRGADEEFFTSEEEDA